MSCGAAHTRDGRPAPAAWQIQWSCYAEIPDRCKYNYDEEAANTCKGRAPGVASAATGMRGCRRLWSISSDGKVSKHITDGMTTRADGKVCAPFLIKARGGPQRAGGSAKKKKASEVTMEDLPTIDPEKDGVNLRDEGAEDGEAANIALAFSETGSMILALFSMWCVHFTEMVLNDGSIAGEPKQVGGRVVARGARGGA